MSTFAPRTVSCASCGHEWTEQLATSINGGRTPEWRAAILDGTFARSACPGCSDVRVRWEEFVYVDFGRRHLLAVFPPAEEGNWQSLEEVSRETFDNNLGARAPEVAQPFGEGFEVRTVFGLDALREKLIVWEAGLDDHWVEAVKLRVLATADDRPVASDQRPRVLAVADERLRLRWPDGTEQDVALELYDALRLDDEANDHLLPLLSSGPYCDVGRLLLFTASAGR